MANERIKKRRPAGGYGRECIGGRIGRRRPARAGLVRRRQGDLYPSAGRRGLPVSLWQRRLQFLGVHLRVYAQQRGHFLPFSAQREGQEPKLCWFAGFPTEAGNKIVPLLAVPETEDDAVRYTVFNKSFVTYMCEAEGLRLSVRVYVTGDRTTRFTLGVENLTEKEIDFFISSYCNPFLLHDVFENGENRWFREVSVAAGENLPDFVVRCNESISRTPAGFQLRRADPDADPERRRGAEGA